MPDACSNCGSELDTSDLPCPGCGVINDTFPSRLNATDRLASAFSYWTFVPAIIFLLWGRFKSNSVVRFHCFQSIFLTVSAAVLAGLMWAAFVSLTFIPFLFTALIVTISCLGCFVLWVVLVAKAFQGRQFKLPLIGRFAEELTNR